MAQSALKGILRVNLLRARIKETRIKEIKKFLKHEILCRIQGGASVFFISVSSIAVDSPYSNLQLSIREAR